MKRTGIAEDFSLSFFYINKTQDNFDPTMNDYLKVVLGTLVWIILVPLIALPVLVLVIWKLCSLAFLYVHYHDASNMRATSMIDNSYLREGSAMIGYACKLEGFVGLKSLQDHFYATFLKADQVVIKCFCIQNH